MKGPKRPPPKSMGSLSGPANCDSPSAQDREDNLIVLKFGGTSTGSPERLSKVIEIIAATPKPCVILSALGKTTNNLLELGRRSVDGENCSIDEVRNFHSSYLSDFNDTQCAHITSLWTELQQLLVGIRLVGEMSCKVTHLLMSYGERLAVRICTLYLNRRGLKARAIDAYDLGLVTTSSSSSLEVEVLPEAYDNIHDKLTSLNRNFDSIPVITGFLGKNREGHITTLGRSGGDFSASIIGAAVHAKEIQIWTDVPGVMTADPRLVPEARTIPSISFQEAAEFAYFGAKVIHPKTMHPAMQMGIPICVKNSFDPDHPGTTVVRQRDHADGELVSGITCKAAVTVVDITSTKMLGATGFLSRLFGVFDMLGLSVDVIATSEVSVSLTLERQTDPMVLEKLQEQLDTFAYTTIQTNKCILSFVCNTTKSAEILGLACQALTKLDIPVEMVSQGASKVNISLVIDNREREVAVRELHRCFFKDTQK